MWGGVGGRRQRQLKVSGADNGHCVQGTGGALGGQSDTLAGMCQACLGMPAHYSPDWLLCGMLPHLAAQVLRTLWVKGQSLDHQKRTWGWGGCGRPAKVPPLA